jgi:hypothetical protein
MAKQKKCCGSCRYWEKPGETTVAWNKDLGKCHIQPPNLGEDGVGLWPETKADGWCGKWDVVEAPVNGKK